MQQPIAIVGGGPAGALAAAVLAQRGARVVLFEEKLAWEKPCGGGLTDKALKQYPFLAATQTEHKLIRRCELISPSGAKVQLDLNSPIAIYSRFALNGLLLERATQAGAEIRRSRVLRLDRAAEGWTLTTAQGEFAARYVVLAAGARTSLRASLTRSFTADELMVTAGYFVPGSSSIIQIQFLKGIAGYIWTFPRADHFSAGICGRADGTTTLQMRQHLEQWLEENGFSLSGARFYAHVLPALSPKSFDDLEVCGGDWMIVGDSAGFVDPITGEGLYYALRSGELCAEALLANSPEQYKLRLEEEIIPELKLAASVSQRFYTGQALGDSVLDLMVKLTAESESFRGLMRDLFAGIQGYRGLRTRLYRTVPAVIAESLSGALRLAWSISDHSATAMNQ